jgi:hypothetical protein
MAEGKVCVCVLCGMLWLLISSNGGAENACSHTGKDIDSHALQDPLHHNQQQQPSQHRDTQFDEKLLCFMVVDVHVCAEANLSPVVVLYGKCMCTTPNRQQARGVCIHTGVCRDGSSVCLHVHGFK